MVKIALFLDPVIVEKGWGREIVFAQKNGYTGKILEYDNSGARMSLEFHAKKHETMYVLKGSFLLEMLDLETSKRRTEKLLPGMSVVIPPYCPHRLVSTSPDSHIFEASTQECGGDTYRIEPGDSQEQGGQDGPAGNPPG